MIVVLVDCVLCSVVELCGLCVLQSSGQCINRVVRLIVWGGEGWEDMRGL